MDAQHKKQIAPAAAQRWSKVMCWPGLRGEAKLAWFTLYYSAASCRLATIDVHPASIAAAQGTTERSGVRALESLAAAGLIQIIDRKVVWKVFILDPLEAAIARPGPKSDGQSELFIDLQEAIDTPADEHEIFPVDRRAMDAPRTRLRPADVAQHPPSLARAPTSETSEVLSISKTLDFGRLRDFTSSTPSASNPRGNSGGCGATSAEPLSMADVLVARLGNAGGLSTAERMRERERIVATIQRVVDDKRLRDTPCLRVADAILAGDYPERELHRVFSYVNQADREGRCKAGRWACFVGVVAKSMREYDQRAK